MRKPICLTAVLVAFVVFAATTQAADETRSAPAAPAGPRRSWQVAVIERCGPSVAAIFAQDKDNNFVSGSGSVVHSDGYILTNDHVVQDRPGAVLLRGFPPLQFRTIGRLWEKDLALLKVEAGKPLVAVPLGRSHDVLAGEPILVGGNPGGRGVVFSSGIVSAPDILLGPSALTMTFFPDDARDRFLQFDAASNPGNSGGPVINAEGEQIAVVVSKVLQEQDINFAIPIDRAHRAFADLVLPEERGDFSTGFVLERGKPVIARVAAKDPAENAGLAAGDTITALGETPVKSALDLLIALVGRKSGERLTVKYVRAGEARETALTLGTYPTAPGLGAKGRTAGLHYRLYRGRFNKCPDFGKLSIVQEGTVADHRLNLIEKLPDDEYALSFDGYVEIPETGVWSVAIGSDDGSRLFLDGELLAENDGPHPMQWTSGRRRLAKGLHPIRIEFFEATGDADLQVVLTRDGSSERLEPKYFVDGPALRP
jgi:S1-C subfamily serine protease